MTNGLYDFEGHAIKKQTSLQMAKETGLKSYNSGRDCINGHVTPVRYTISGACKECQEEADKGIVNVMKEKRRIAKDKKIKDEIGFKATVKKVYERSTSW